MKKLSTIVLTLALLACALFSLTACGKVEGLYKFESLTYTESGISVTINAGEELRGITITEDFMSVELKSDGTAILISFGETNYSTWTQDGDKIKFFDEDGDQEGELTIDGDKLMVDEDGMKFVLAKQ